MINCTTKLLNYFQRLLKYLAALNCYHLIAFAIFCQDFFSSFFDIFDDLVIKTKLLALNIQL